MMTCGEQEEIEAAAAAAAAWLCCRRANSQDCGNVALNSWF